MSKFIRVKCKCGNEQNIFAYASQEIKCLVCSETMARPRGGKVEVSDECKVLKVL
ncbi:MAG: 30S ribosomal protein S27e [Candidatus Micrarchaeota archaeon]|nr:30S ribosomal protein S27e [Candidatus Micrarchaeota archaeon]